VLYLISVTSSEVLRNHLCVSSKGPADGPKSASRSHLQDDFIKWSARWTEHHVAHPAIKCPFMTGTLQATTRAVVLDGTTSVRTPATVGSVFTFIGSQQYSGIISGWIVKVEARTWQQRLRAFDPHGRIRNHRILGCEFIDVGRRQNQPARGQQQIRAENSPVRV